MRKSSFLVTVMLLVSVSTTGCGSTVDRNDATPGSKTLTQSPVASTLKSEVALVPLQSEFAPFSIDIPEGWQVQSTFSGDMVTIYPPGGGYPKVTVRTRKLGTVQPPSSEQEEIDFHKEMSVENIKVNTVQWPGAQVAYEVTYEDRRHSLKLAVLSLLLYGTTHYTFADFEAPVEDFGKWEPTFRKMIGTFKPRALNVEPLPGRP